MRECSIEGNKKKCNCTYEPCEKRESAVSVSPITGDWENYRPVFFLMI